MAVGKIHLKYYPICFETYIIEHYERLLKHKNDELERTRKSWRKLQDYKNLSVEDRALQDKKEEEEESGEKLILVYISL